MRLPWRRKPEMKAPDGGDLRTYHLRTGRNAVHDLMFSDCRDPRFPHRHDLGVITSEQDTRDECQHGRR